MAVSQQKGANDIQVGRLISTATLGTEPGADLPADFEFAKHVYHDDDLGLYILAWKAALLARREDGSEVFLPLVAPTPYGIDSVAVCAKACGSVPPNIDCTCGFYALLERDALVGLCDEPGLTFLEVALSGRVALNEGPGLLGRIVRAQFQRVLSHWPASDTWTGDGPPFELGGSLARVSRPRDPGSSPAWVPVPTPDWTVEDGPPQLPSGLPAHPAGNSATHHSDGLPTGPLS